MENRENVLVVGMFDGFSLTWNGNTFTGGTKSGQTQFTQLMQYLLHNREKGVSREQLERFLFEDRDLENMHHTLRTVVYNAKKKLRAAGLPDVNYIEQQGGVYYWTKQIPVLEDAVEMESLYRKVRGEGTADEKLGWCLEACALYTGEFLPDLAGTMWVAQEAKRYRTMFCALVEEAVQLLRTQGDFDRMEELGRYASEINPLSDWETVTMEALVSRGRYEEAQQLYNDTVERYFQEEGLRPSRRFMELFNRLGQQMEYQYAVLDDIQAELAEESTEQGGYYCSYPVFQGIYRMMERGGQSVYLMLCTVVDSKGNPMKEGPLLDELSERLGKAISSSVRRSDAVNRFGKGQYLVLLVNTTRENCAVVQKRINYHFLVRRQRTGVHYYVNSVICTPGPKPTQGESA